MRFFIVRVYKNKITTPYAKKSWFKETSNLEDRDWYVIQMVHANHLALLLA
jgi:hypothetical protein